MSKLKDICREHLESKNCTLWGRAFDIKDENSLEAAAEWQAQQVREVVTLRQEQEVEPLPEYKPDRLRYSADRLAFSPAWDENMLEDAAVEVERLQAEVSDLRFLIGQAVSDVRFSQWRGWSLRVKGSLVRRLRAAAQNGSPADTHEGCDCE